LGDENLDGFTISKAEEDTLSMPAGLFLKHSIEKTCISHG